MQHRIVVHQLAHQLFFAAQQNSKPSGPQRPPHLSQDTPVKRWILLSTFGVLLFFFQDDETEDGLDEEEGSTHGPFLAALTLIFVCEMGDKTQLATGLLAANLRAPVEVLAGALAGLLIVSVIGLELGTHLRERVPVETVHRLGGLSFIAMGAAALFI